ARPEPPSPPSTWHVIPRVKPLIETARRPSSPWMLAASVLVAFGLGNWFGQPSEPAPVVPQMAAQRPEAVEPKTQEFPAVPALGGNRQQIVTAEPQPSSTGPPIDPVRVPPTGIAPQGELASDFVPNEIEQILKAYGRRV